MITNADAVNILLDGKDGDLTAAMRRAMEDVGMVRVSKTIKINGDVKRVWIVRNADKWKIAKGCDLADEAMAARLRLNKPLLSPAFEVIAEG